MKAREERVRRKAGRPSKEELARRRAAERIAVDKMADYLLDRMKPVLDMYYFTAMGRNDHKIKIKKDPATLRHLVDRFLPPAAKTVNIGTVKTAEDFYDRVERELQEKREAAQRKLLTAGVLDDEDKEKLH